MSIGAARAGVAVGGKKPPKAPRAGVAPLGRLLSELIVYESPQLRKVRIGARHDGGYVVPELHLDSVDFLYTVGVGNNLDFERELRTRGRARIRLFDHTVGAPDNLPEHAKFFPVGLGVSSRSVTTLFQYGERPSVRSDRLWLKADIEGWEWEALALTAPDDLGLFEVIIIEFHWLTNRNADFIIRQIDCLKKINRQFRLIHAHGNNYASHLSTLDMRLPDCLEPTFVRADLLPDRRRLNRSPLPGPLDAPCNPDQADLDLNAWPFRDFGRARTRPTQSETVRRACTARSATLAGDSHIVTA